MKNTTKIWANTFSILAVNDTSIVTFREHSKKEDLEEVLQKFRQANPGERLIVILDSFSSYNTILFTEYATSNNI